MLTNLISFLYDINVDYLRKNEDGYVFFYNNSFYVFKNTTLKEENIIYLNDYKINYLESILYTLILLY
jgi:hypothetical protein